MTTKRPLSWEALAAEYEALYRAQWQFLTPEYFSLWRELQSFDLVFADRALHTGLRECTRPPTIAQLCAWAAHERRINTPSDRHLLDEELAKRYAPYMPFWTPEDIERGERFLAVIEAERAKRANLAKSKSISNPPA